MAKFTLRALVRQWASAWKRRTKRPRRSLEFFHRRFETAWETYAQGLGTATDFIDAHNWLLKAMREEGYSDADILSVLQSRLPSEEEGTSS